ncbi:hypothetical protein MMC32_003237 [Xylographa parallela]|nr:hypothetical protein [Xylographa parallela]
MLHNIQHRRLANQMFSQRTFFTTQPDDNQTAPSPLPCPVHPNESSTTPVTALKTVRTQPVNLPTKLSSCPTNIATDMYLHADSSSPIRPVSRPIATLSILHCPPTHIEYSTPPHPKQVHQPGPLTPFPLLPTSPTPTTTTSSSLLLRLLLPAYLTALTALLLAEKIPSTRTPSPPPPIFSTDYSPHQIYSHRHLLLSSTHTSIFPTIHTPICSTVSPLHQVHSYRHLFLSSIHPPIFSSIYTHRSSPPSPHPRPTLKKPGLDTLHPNSS